MKKIQRIYKTKDVSMLMVAATIIENAIRHRETLQQFRSVWTGDFFETLKTDIDDAIQKILGQDRAKDLRKATQYLYAHQQEILFELSLLKTQIHQDFKNQPDKKQELLTTLGFNQHYPKARKKNQEALIQLLFRFKSNLTPQWKTELLEKGYPETALDKILAYAEIIKEAEIQQEFLKGIRKDHSAETIQLYNDLYLRVISLANIAHKILSDNKTIQEQFSFNKIYKTYHFNPTDPSDESENEILPNS
jgi:hypothetical protein